MRSNSFGLKASGLRCLAWLCLSSVAAAQAPQVPASNSPPTAIILSGGSSSRTSDTTPANGLRSPHSGSAWNAPSNPVNTFRNDTQASGTGSVYRSQPAVVTAGAQQSLADVSAGSNVSPAFRSAAVPVDNQPIAKASADSQRLPLKPPSTSAPADDSHRGGSTLQMLLSVGSSLAIVVGLFLGAAWCFRKTLSTSLGGGLPKQVVNVLGRSSLSGRQQMVLVRFGNKLLLVSVIQGEARTLSEITDPLEVDQLVGLCESSQPGSITNSFKSVLLQEGSRA
jgi:flagellar biogenesis protein FliO